HAEATGNHGVVPRGLSRPLAQIHFQAMAETIAASQRLNVALAVERAIKSPNESYGLRSRLEQGQGTIVAQFPGAPFLPIGWQLHLDVAVKKLLLGGSVSARKDK